MFNKNEATITERDAKLAELREIVRETAGQFDTIEPLLRNEEALLAFADRIASALRGRPDAGIRLPPSKDTSRPA
jgi:hypothetical protein